MKITSIRQKKGKRMARKQTTYERYFDELELDTYFAVAILTAKPKEPWQFWCQVIIRRGNWIKFAG